jgi:hypothetical protein
MDSIFCNDGMNEKTDMEAAYDNMNYFIVGTLVYGLGLTISAWFVSRCLWDGETVLENIEVKEEEVVEELYEDKYPLVKDLSGNKPINTTIIEHTPDGSVIMSYNYDKEGFEYWVDNKNIKYNYLETVARKFVRMNFCCDLYIDRKENIKKQNEELDRIEKEEKEEKEEEQKKKEKMDQEFKELEEEDSVFVKSKLCIKEKQKKEIIDRTKIAATEANKYIRVGKCSEFKWLKKTEKRKKKKKISFNDFKNNFC